MSEWAPALLVEGGDTMCATSRPPIKGKGTCIHHSGEVQGPGPAGSKRKPHARTSVEGRDSGISWQKEGTLASAGL